MSLKFEIQPAANPTPESERTAKLADPGFGRIFTDHMAVVRYDQAKGWHDARAMPALGLVVANDRHVIGENPAEARIRELCRTLLFRSRIRRRLDFEFQTHFP